MPKLISLLAALLPSLAFANGFSAGGNPLAQDTAVNSTLSRRDGNGLSLAHQDTTSLQGGPFYYDFNAPDYSFNRFAWKQTYGRMATNSITICFAGVGWAIDSEFIGAVTNLLASRPFAGFASFFECDMSSPNWCFYDQGQGSIWNNVANSDMTNWAGINHLGALTNSGSIYYFNQRINGSGGGNYRFSGRTNLTATLGNVQVIAWPGGGSFNVDVSTNNEDNTLTNGHWRVVASSWATNSVLTNKVVWFTNAVAAPTRVRVVGTSPGWTPVVGGALIDTRITNGIILCMYAHGGTGTGDPAFLTNTTYPLFKVWSPDLVLLSFGALSLGYTGPGNTLDFYRRGFPSADLVIVEPHVPTNTFIYQTNVITLKQWCMSNSAAYFNGYTLTSNLWGGAAGTGAFGYYSFDNVHMSDTGYQAFGQLLSRWLALDRASVANLALNANSNGLPDIWEFLAGLTNNAGAYADSDHDGWSDYQEVWAGANPLDRGSVPTNAPQTAPVAFLLPDANALGNSAVLNLRLWDAEGNGATPYLQFRVGGSTNWQDATIARADFSDYSTNTRLAALPAGTNHTLVWNVLADLGARVTTNVALRIRARDVSLTGDWSPEAPFTANTTVLITSVRPTPGGIAITWQGGTNATQFVERLNNLADGNWATVFTNLPPTPASCSFTDAVGANLTRFYRIRVTR